ncbi:MAG: TRAP transporter TatT component family protein [Candidatus Auribacterota bacterium]|nr:TRAP transporter TatT component family protein [Candidatus Auribacterota bacterium]
MRDAAMTNYLKPMLRDQALAMNMESDFNLAQTALPANIKLLEGLVLSYPSRRDLKVWVSEALCGYGFGFVEDNDKKRASMLYLRAKEYAVQNAVRHIQFKAEYIYDINEFEKWLSKRSEKDIDILYWLGHSWGAYIAINLNNPDAMADLPKVRWIMERVIALDERFYNAGAHLFLGSLYASIPVMFGGSEEKSLYHFNRGFSLNGEKFLLAHYYFAKTYCVRFLKKDAFYQSLEYIEQFDTAQYPNLRLFNSIAVYKADQLKQQAEELFFDDENF